ncbi:hypothetical protein EC973_001167 [Apophysomyces ossiformis]|uniref:GATA-type domain-containing protein n=1 Tax=Apophysomyces ossiformis TaxID=679940 RepID=A0A8H7EPJ2_9FUNG|nr:hypothetical protein EC973_001167 [Apophysomyces ossiformis]
MKYLGTCTLELGPHLFPETAFYEATRVESWAAIAANATVPSKPTLAKDKEKTITEKQAEQSSLSIGSTESTQLTQSGSSATVPPENTQQQQEGAVDTTTKDSAEVPNEPGQNTMPLAPPDASDNLVFTDVVIEFKEVPNERFLFPKDVILELISMQAPFELYASFLLPLDPSAADDFFIDPKTKMEKWGAKSSLALVRKFAAEAENKKPGKEAPKVAEKEEAVSLPANMRMIDVNGDILKALVAIITKPEIVREKMMKRMEIQPTKSILKLHSLPDSNDRAIEDMLSKVYSIPEIVTGPVSAEKKRNETINAIKLGKRPRTEETEVPKSKHANIKDDGLRRCHYCSTKRTTMWRPGPAGSGTLCNGCGLLWKQEKILKGAPVLTKDEERQSRKEQRAKELLLLEEQERERQRQEWEKQRAAEKAKLEGARQNQSLSSPRTTATAATTTTTTTTTNSSPDGARKETSSKGSNASRANIGYFAAQFLQQQHQQQQTVSPPRGRTPVHGSPSSSLPSAAAPTIFVNVQAPVPTTANGSNTKPIPAPPPPPTTTTTTTRPDIQPQHASPPQALTQQSQQPVPTLAPYPASAPTPAAASLAPASSSPLRAPTSSIAPAASAPPVAASSTPVPSSSSSSSSSSAPPLSLYSSAGIPLPTLSIDFGQIAFAHPNCGVTLVEGFFSIRLCKDGFGPSTVDIDKAHLQNSQFEIITEGHLGREVLIMTCFPSGGQVENRFNTTLIKPNDYRMKIHFLEKLDPSGGAVVKRILQRWLSTVPTLPSSS